jgi:hypothetical protein
MFVCLFVKRLDRRQKPSACTGVPCGILPTLNEIFFYLIPSGRASCQCMDDSRRNLRNVNNQLRNNQLRNVNNQLRKVINQLSNVNNQLINVINHLAGEM